MRLGSLNDLVRAWRERAKRPGRKRGFAERNRAELLDYAECVKKKLDELPSDECADKVDAFLGKPARND